MTDTPAPHTPSDDPRVDILAESLVGYANWHRYDDDGRDAARFDAKGLLARLDAAAPARDDALARWLDGEIAEAEADYAARDWRDSWNDAPRYELRVRLRALREVRRDRLGATTNTTPEEGQ